MDDERDRARIELAIINEAYHAVGEGVAQPPDIDRAMKLGANHPYGPFERAGQLGLRTVVDGLRESGNSARRALPCRARAVADRLDLTPPRCATVPYTACPLTIGPCRCT